MTKTVLVYLDTGEPLKIGYLYLDEVAGKEVFSFSYSTDYIERGNPSFIVDTSLFFDLARQPAPSDRGLFGAIMDSCPDRWGRMLIKAKEEAMANKENRRPRHLSELDYLLGVSDYSRMGALRFKTSEDGPFLSESIDVPPLEFLGKMEEVSRKIEDREPVEEKELLMLIAPGSSLGGARPKCSVEGKDGSLWLAKFPSKGDDYDVSSFEIVTRDLAALCGINVPEARVASFSRYGKTFLSKRFDRIEGKRIPYSSAMCLLGKTDGEEASYLDIVGFIQSHSSTPKDDLVELYKRLLFSLIIGNTDDHLRNHGFLFDGKGYRLSPAFDINPNCEKDRMTLSLDGYSHQRDLNLAMSLSGFFYIRTEEAEEIKALIQRIVKENYFSLTKKYGIPEADATRFYKNFLLD